MSSPASICLLLAFLFIPSSRAMQTYIVYMGSSPISHMPEEITRSHHHMLKSVLKSKEAAEESILYSYTRSFNGFAARLHPEHVVTLSKMPGVFSIFPNKKNYLHTTRSWEFLNFENTNLDIVEDSLWTKSNFGKDVIIGSLDTGVWPESQSFNDDSFGPIPSKWKGTCVNGTAFNAANCNRKLIGAKFYLKSWEAECGPLNETATGDFRSPRDKDGHGTHTSSTAGGQFVPNANIFGFANGTAVGGAPSSRIAIYKVCWPKIRGECFDADILAAMDDAIQDGVDILTLSLGGSVPLPPLFKDGIAIGAYHAVQNGIMVVCSAGNAGPTVGSVVNVAPWILTVAASSMDRDFSSYAKLGDNTTYKGNSLSQLKLEERLYPLVAAGNVGNASALSLQCDICEIGSLDANKVAGKIVVCLRGKTSRVSKGEAVRIAGGAGMILANAPTDGAEIVADAHVLPATQVDAASGAAIFAYINSSSSPMGYITPATTVLGVKPAPVMAAFSSQGPNTLIGDILKPDITGPGVNVLAAYTEASPPTGLELDHRVVKFNIVSGTSMSCPHLAGISALLRALHPEWSPAAIKSAIMTTATTQDNRGQLILTASSVPAGPFNFGAGHVNPNKAADPGLIYDATVDDYFHFLCSLNYSSDSLRILTGDNSSCPDATISPSNNFNSPSIAISNLTGNATVTRTVTNVGGNCSYEVFIKAPPGISVSIQPSKLQFAKTGEKQSFTVSFNVTQPPTGSYSFGYFIWADGRHQVRSSIAVRATSAVPSSNSGGIIRTIGEREAISAK